MWWPINHPLIRKNYLSMTQTISPEAAKREIHGAKECALLDIREHGLYGEGHPFLSVHCPYSDFEQTVVALVPNRQVSVILMDDGDGISDDRDACPQMPGMTLFDGCPDADDDGIADPKDACPELFGSIEQDGCPPATTDTDISRQLNQQRFLFSPNSNQIQQERLADKLATFLRNNPAYKLRLRGYDDGGAADATEQRWAYFRVVAVHDFLTARGIAPERLVQETPAAVRPQAGAQGQPEMPNLLRRVEIWLYK